ncbi:MAG: hypothetical protein ACXWXM_06700 [Actinomycetota bacterium]
MNDSAATLGRALVDALASQDLESLRATLSDDVSFRLLVPKGPQSESGAADTAGRFAGWFGEAEADDVRLEASSV